MRKKAHGKQEKLTKRKLHNYETYILLHKRHNPTRELATYQLSVINLHSTSYQNNFSNSFRLLSI